MKTIFRINMIILLAGVILCSNKFNLYAQQNQSLIYGSVVMKYSSGEVTLNGVTVEIYNEDDHFVSSVITSESGNFSFNKISHGTYYIKVRKMDEGYKMYKKLPPNAKGQPSSPGKGRYYSFHEHINYPRIKFKVNSPETNLSKIIVYPLK